MKNIFLKISLTLIYLFSFTVYSQTETADINNIDQIIKWAKDGVTTKIIFPPGTYEFSISLNITNENLILEGTDRESTILKLTENKGAFINAFGNNTTVTNLTIDGDNKQTEFAYTLFKFNKSKGHQFINVEFRNTYRNAINTVSGWATDGLYVKDCIFSNIGFFCIQFFNRNTNIRGGEVITSVDKIIIEDTVFKTGYSVAISSDNGNDRENDGTKDIDGKLIGRRYTESTSLNGSIIKNCTFETSKKFHIAMVQTKDVIIQDNTFEGMTDDASGGSQPLHFEQFSQNIEIYNNVFSMNTTVPKAYSCIHFRGTEGHVRSSQKQPSDTYTEWLFFINGGPERRADTKCANTGNIDVKCKRDVHAYGAKNIYIAGNTFNASDKFHDYLFVNEGENIQLGLKKDGTVSLNDFQGDINLKKISLNGNDEGTCGVKIMEGQNITMSNIKIDNVKFDLEACILTNPIVFLEAETPPSPEEETPIINLPPLLPVITPNPASNEISINIESDIYTVAISDLSGKRIKTIFKNEDSDNLVNLDGISSGFYMISLYDIDNKIIIKKLIIK